MIEWYGSTSDKEIGGQPQGRKIQLYSNILIQRLENRVKHEARKRRISEGCELPIWLPSVFLVTNIFVDFSLLFLKFSSQAFTFNCSLCGDVYTSVKMIVFTLWILKDKSLSRPIYKLQRHGYLCIHLLFSKDIAVCMDVERNPGPTRPIHFRDFSLNGNHWNSSNWLRYFDRLVLYFGCWRFLHQLPSLHILQFSLILWPFNCS